MRGIWWMVLIGLLLWSLAGCTGTPAASPVTAKQILASAARYQDQLITLRGYGLITATLPLCKGYIGLDTRTQFVDAENNLITAVDRVGSGKAIKGDALRTFHAYVRVFDGELGCPGQTRRERIVYLEIVGVE